jgi:hypothetical protein
MRNKETMKEAQRRLLREKLVKESRKRISEGAAPEDIVLMLHDESLSIPESIWVLQQVSHLSVAQLKNLVTMHRVWESVVQNTEPLHDELEKAISKPLTHPKNRAKLSK